MDVSIVIRLEIQMLEEVLDGIQSGTMSVEDALPLVQSVQRDLHRLRKAA